MNDRQHIAEETYLDFVQDKLNPDDTLEFLAHISSCNHCADRLDTYLSAATLPAPRDFKEKVLTATRRPEVKLAMKARESSKKMQLLFYSLKVGTATIAALIMLILTMNAASPLDSGISRPETQETHESIFSSEDHYSFTDRLRDNMYKLSDSMKDFSNNIIHMEVTKNDKKEK